MKTLTEKSEYTAQPALAASPTEAATRAIYDINKNSDSESSKVPTEINMEALRAEIQRQNTLLATGDTQHIEEMLQSQSHVLQELFTHFVQRMGHAGEMQQIEAFTHLALKAQGQCRQTLSTLCDLRNPRRKTFIEQQNNAINQQINNGDDHTITPDATNELIQRILDEHVDTRAQEEDV